MTLLGAFVACGGDDSRKPPVDEQGDLGSIDEPPDLAAPQDLKIVHDVKPADGKSAADLAPPNDLSSLDSPVDLAPAPDLTPPPIYRPLPAATARLRGLALTGSGDYKLCIFGDDDNELPYALVRATAGTDLEATVAPYTLVPAGVPLTVHVVENAAPWTLDCHRQNSQPLAMLIGGKSTLGVGRYYSAVRAGLPASKACATDATQAHCAFFPPREGAAPTIDCPGQGHYLVEDGKRNGDHYEAGYRVINLSDNLSDVSYSNGSPDASGAVPQQWSSHYRLAPYASYWPPLAAGYPVTLCPWFLIDCAQGGGWSADDGYAAMDACTAHWATSPWIVGIGISARLSAAKATTLYFVGGSYGLAKTFKGLTGVATLTAVADVADPLP